MLEAIAHMEGNSLPCVRCYENDVARLSLAGSVAFEQAITAGAADGGEAAGEHSNGGLSAMVVETLFPGPDDEHSTVSTRLFLPTRIVEEKAKKLRSSLPKDIVCSTNSRNILAMTFRQVVLQQLWNFELELFVPGSQRNMEDLGSQREVTKSFALSSSDEKVLSGLAEAVCIVALESTQREFFQRSSGKASHGFFNWLSKAKKFASKESSVIIHNFEDVIVENAKSLLDKFKFERANYNVTNKKQTSSIWPSLMHSKLERIGGSEFSIWTSEYVPAYRLEIDADRLADLKFEGWERTTGNRWEVPLTHSQMVGLANILDMYFEDVHTLPYKQLSCNVVRSPNKLSQSKRDFSLLGFLRTTLVAATLLFAAGVMAKVCLPHLYNTRRETGEYNILQSSDNAYEEEQPLLSEPSKVEALCSTVVRKIKDCYGWSGDIKYESSVGAWMGELPIYLRSGYGSESNGQESISASFDVLATSDEELKSSVQDIASYQVVLSKDGKVVGFQPTSGMAVNHWSSNPIAKELYGGKLLSPGLLEPGLKINKPDEVIVLELLMSLNQDNCFALARPVQ